jgi:hypothetical protein
MKKNITTLIIVLLAANGWAQSNAVPIASVEIPNGSNVVLTVANFLTIKNFILTNGLSQTYCQMYNGNPYFGFKGMNAYLNPDTHQANINCDRSKSDFNSLVLQEHKPIEYWDVLLKTNQNVLVVHKSWSKIAPDVLVKTVEDRFQQLLKEIESKKSSQER